MTKLPSEFPSLYGRTRGVLILAYFRSGWAFLIPYLFAYLLYAWLKWPVNPVDSGQWTVVPCLLHVYWFLHGLHVLLAALALRAWWQHGRKEQGAGSREHVTSDRLLSTAYRLLPWLCLALLFYIPGVYLEFPADPWEHYRRINEWSWHMYIGEHTYWSKSSYFLAYSLIGKAMTIESQLMYLELLQVTCCLMLQWQYYRLARACGLGERTSMVFMLLQSLLYGNNIFSFYRYYGISSSIYAQLGAVALTRIALEALHPQEKHGAGIKGKAAQSSLRAPFSDLPRIPSPVSRLLKLAGAGIFLLPLIAFNHMQGLGVAVLGIAAVLVWRLIEWRRSMIGWLAVIAVVLSIATILWFPRHPLLDEFYRPQGWLATWYGFNFLQLSSPAFDRAEAIIGLAGLVNLATGLYLLRRNHVVTWLTLTPVIALCLPFVAIPLSNILSYKGAGEIITYARMFFAIPTGLALVTLGSSFWSPASSSTHRLDPVVATPQTGALPFLILITSIVIFLTIPVRGPYYNRFWHSLFVPPSDLRLAHVIRALDNQPSAPGSSLSLLLASRAPAFVAVASGKTNNAPLAGRFINIAQPSQYLPWLAATIEETIPDSRTALLLINSLGVYSPYSMAGYLSDHWLAQEIAINHATGPEKASLLNLKIPRSDGYSELVELRLPESASSPDKTH